MLYLYLVQCQTLWKRRSQPSRCVTTLGEIWFFPLGMLDELPRGPERNCDPYRSQLRHFLLFVALACSIRITSVITWAFLFPPLFWQLSRNPTLLRAFITDTISAAYVYERLSLYPIHARVCFRCVACCLLFTLDSVYNGAPTLTLLNFLRVNVSSVSLFYGSAPWHYYLTQAFPLLAGPILPFVLQGAYLAFMESSRQRRLLLYTVIWTSAVYSCVGHKEWRFLHPLVPIMHLLAARSLISLYDRSNSRYSPRNTGLSIKRTHLVLLALLSIAPSLYVMRWHSSAQIGVLSYLRDRSDTELRSIGFLMPCHSTPAQSHLHRPIPVWHLSCEPPLL